MENNMSYLAIAIFALTYVGIVTEKIPRAFCALIGGGLMIYCGFLTQEEAVKEFIDFNTIGLLTGMMILISVVRLSGFFEAMALWAVKVTKGRPRELLVLLALITAVGASLIDSVTAALLLAPMTISLCRKMNLSPVPFLIMEVLMANIGGTALMVGNPPNVMIGSATGLDFNAFFLNLAPGVLITMVVIIGLLLAIYHKDMPVHALTREELDKIDVHAVIKDEVILKRSLTILGLTIVGFILHGFLHLDSATIAMTGGILALIVCRIDAHEAFKHVDWDTLFFFMGLFIVVGGLEVTGVITALAEWGISIAAGNTEVLTFFILWLAGIASAFVDNIPFTATMIPLIHEIQSMMGMEHADYMWWSLALGACYGGNGTLIGASPNIIVVAIAAAEGIRISFLKFMKLCFPLMVVSLIISHAYLYIRYFLFQ